MMVLIDATGIASRTTGVGQYAFQLLSALSEIDSVNGYTILVQRRLRGDHPIWRLAARDNFEIKRVASSAVGPRKQLILPFAMHRTGRRYDVVHFLNSEAAILHGLRSVVTIHDLKFLRHPEYLRRASRLKGYYLRFAIKEAVARAKRVIAVSSSTKRDIVSLLGTEEPKIVVIPEASYLGIYGQALPEGGAIAMDRYGLRRPYFLFIGERRPHKNLERLVDAFAIFKQRYDDWDCRLVIVGKQYAQYTSPLDRVGDRDLRDSVQFTGFVPDEDLRGLYSGAAAFLFVSLYEGFGIPILEAMESGTPVITSNVSSMPEVAGDAAILVDPYDSEAIAKAMAEIMQSPKLREELAQRGYRRARCFSWEETARRTLQVYREVSGA